MFREDAEEMPQQESQNPVVTNPENNNPKVTTMTSNHFQENWSNNFFSTFAIQQNMTFNQGSLI